jgi:hypothetical protein
MLRSAKKDEKWGPHKTSMFRLHSQLLKLARPRDPNPIFLHDGVIPFPEAENAFEVRPYKTDDRIHRMRGTVRIVFAKIYSKLPTACLSD